MNKSRLLRLFGFVAISMLAALQLAAQSPDPVAVLQQRLNAQFKLTRSTADRSDIVTAGDVIQIHQDGLIMYATNSPLPPSNTSKNGKISQGFSGFGKDLAIGMASPEGTTSNDYAKRRWVAEEKCWVTSIQAQKDGVVFQLYSDPYNDVRYYANLKIPYPNKKEIPTPDVFLPIVASVLTVVGQDNSGSQPSEAAAAPGAPAAAPADAPASGLQPSTFTGQFIQQGTGLLLYLYPDGSTKVTGPDGRARSFGQFSVSGDSITVESWVTNSTIAAKIEGNTLTFSKRNVWTRSGDAPAPSIAPSQAATPAQMAAVSGEYIQQANGRHLTLPADGSYTTTLTSGKSIAGQYSVDGSTVVVTAPAAIAGSRFSLVGDKLVAIGGTDIWVRTGNAPAPAAPATPAAALQPIAPPPPPPDMPPPTVSMGQNKDQVTAILGQPTKAAKIGVKEIYYYKDMKVTFTNGKVSNVE
jgi:hypothetical protein